MRPTKTIIAALFVCAILGTGASMIEVQGTPEPVRIDVPAMQHGDRYEYAIQHRASPDAEWVDTPYVHVYEVGEPQVRLDAFVRPTPVVPIHDWIEGLEHRPQRTEWVSLETRLAIGSGWDEQELAASEPHGAVSDFLVSKPGLLGLEFQGAQLVQNDAHTGYGPISPARAETEGGGGGGGHDPWLDTYTFGPWRWDPSARPQRQPESYPTVPMTTGEPAILGDHVVLPVQWTQGTVYSENILNHTLWFSSHRALPVLIETHLLVPEEGGEARHESSWRNHLIHVEEGDGPVAWGQPAQEAAPPERSATDGMYPADGTGSHLPYLLSTAIHDVSDLAGDAQWLTWRTQHPDAVLVGAEYTRGAMTWTGQETYEWRLYFADGDDAYEVRTERHRGAAIARVEAMGERQLPDVSDARPVAEPITIAEAERLWRTIFGHPADVAPTYVHWGLYPTMWETGGPCLKGLSSGDSPVPAPLDDLTSVQVGLGAHGPCETDNSTGYYEMIEVDMERPTLIGTFHTTFEMDFMGAASARAAPAVEPRPLHQDSRAWSIGSPDPLATAVVSSTLLAVALTAFFLPALKFVGTQAWLAIPAFSRVKRSDVLNQKERERLLGHIEANPGTTPTELAKATGLGWGTVVHHLETMRKHGVVKSRVEGRHKRFFTSDAAMANDIDARALLANVHTQRYYAALLDEPGLAASELAARVGVSPPGAHQQLQRLASSGLVERRRDGRHVRYYPLPVPPRPYDADAAVEVA